MKKVFKIVFLLVLSFFVLAVPVMAFAEEEEPPVEEQPQEEVVEEENEVENWFKEMFSADKVAMYLSWVAYIGTIIGLVTNFKKLKEKNTMTLNDVNSEVQSKIKATVSKEVAEKFDKYFPNLIASQEKTNEIMSIFAKILALSQENTPESKVAILNLIQDLGVVGKDLVDNAKQIVEDTQKAFEEKKEETDNKLSEIIEEYDGTSI